MKHLLLTLLALLCSNATGAALDHAELNHRLLQRWLLPTMQRFANDARRPIPRQCNHLQQDLAQRQALWQALEPFWAIAPFRTFATKQHLRGLQLNARQKQRVYAWLQGDRDKEPLVPLFPKLVMAAENCQKSEFIAKKLLDTGNTLQALLDNTEALNAAWYQLDGNGVFFDAYDLTQALSKVVLAPLQLAIEDSANAVDMQVALDRANNVLHAMGMDFWRLGGGTLVAQSTKILLASDQMNAALALEQLQRIFGALGIGVGFNARDGD